MTDSLIPEIESPVPVLPLRDVVVFPHMVIPLFVGRKKSIKALEYSMEIGKHILLVAQKNAADDDPGVDDIYTVGTIASILQLLKLPDGTVKVLVEGESRRGGQQRAGRDPYHRVVNFAAGADGGPAPGRFACPKIVEATPHSLIGELPGPLNRLGAVKPDSRTADVAERSVAAEG